GVVSSLGNTRVYQGSAHHPANRAQSMRFPGHLHSLSFHDSSKPQIVQPPELAEPLALPAPASSVPRFGQLLYPGRIDAVRPLILGYSGESGQRIEGSWRDLFSCGIGALQGAGKSWLCAFILAQSAAQGGRLIVCDPHTGDDESLAIRIAALQPAYM